ncbi:MAG: alkaline phosphatase family protein, partial [Alistipes sp.]|nr:alkaline phosphatase family protein [Alistipes sp.]
DMYYRLDRDLADFLTFLFAQVDADDVLVVFTAAHGTSPSYDYGPRPAERFNNRQFAVIVNGFLNVRYGAGDWVLLCENNCLWLNHNLIYERGLNLADVQNEVAVFAMQFDGVSHALAGTAMRTSYFGSGYARKMQNGFYPRRSGDVVLNLVPGCIEERERCVSSSGSLYGYDTQVPLIFYGAGVGAQRVGRRVEMTAVAPTLAHVAGITEPSASEGEVLEEIVEL